MYEAPTMGAGISARFGKAKDAVLGGISAGLTSFGLKRKDKTPSPVLSPTGSSPRPSLAKR